MSGDAAHHLGRVLRAEAGQLYELSDGERVWLARVEETGRDRVEFALVEPIAGSEPAVETTLLLAVVKFDSFEWAIEKATELGVRTIVPLAAARSEKGLLQAAEKRSERWRKILLEASQQSRRVRIPELRAAQKPAVAFKSARGVRVMLSERAEALPLRRLLGVPQGSLDLRSSSGLEKNGSKDPPLQKDAGDEAATVATLAIGPEGGWTDEEFAAAEAAGFRQASLGSLILRTETAVVAALANLNYALG